MIMVMVCMQDPVVFVLKLQLRLPPRVSLYVEWDIMVSRGICHVKIKVHTLDIVPLRTESPPQKHSHIARVLKRLHSKPWEAMGYLINSWCTMVTNIMAMICT